jgi:hypothetical protein
LTDDEYNEELSEFLDVLETTIAQCTSSMICLAAILKAQTTDTIVLKKYDAEVQWPAEILN